MNMKSTAKSAFLRGPNPEPVCVSPYPLCALIAATLFIFCKYNTPEMDFSPLPLLFWSHTRNCSGLTVDSGLIHTQYVMLGNESRVAVCKISTLPAVPASSRVLLPSLYVSTIFYFLKLKYTQMIPVAPNNHFFKMAKKEFITCYNSCYLVLTVNLLIFSKCLRSKH